MINKTPNKMSKRNRVSIAEQTKDQSSETSSNAFYKTLKQERENELIETKN